jgi:glycine cleavage system H protein
MPVDPLNTLAYRRARFSTRLPLDRRYTASHYWLLEVASGTWRIGLTKFATRMLGDLVEIDFSLAAAEPLALGQTIGSIEGFKAISDLIGAASGSFAGSNPALQDDPTLMDSDPYDRGWLYEVRGEPDSAAVDARGYAAVLDAIIDRLQQASATSDGEENCPRL